MVQVEFDRQLFSAEDGVNLLSALDQQGIKLPRGCRAGICQACLVQITQGLIPPNAQEGLSPAQIKLGLAMACRCEIRGALRAQTPQESAERFDCELIQRQWLTAEILQLCLSKPFDYKAGQFIRLFPWITTTGPEAQLSRCYSLASLPAQPHLEVHVRVLPNGQVSPLLAKLRLGAKLQVQGPMGRCFYQAKSLDQPLLLAAIGTGMAPVLGVARAVVAAGHRGPVYCVMGAKQESGLYTLPGLHQVAAAANIHLIYVVQGCGPHSDTYEVGDIYSKIRALLPDMNGMQAYICGPASFVQKLKKQCFLTGCRLDDIFCDAFLPS